MKGATKFAIEFLGILVLLCIMIFAVYVTVGFSFYFVETCIWK